jgi:hypothetical protein
MKHHGGWQLDQPHPGRFHWRSPLGHTYRTRGEPIAPDLPEPLDRAPDDPELDDPDTPRTTSNHIYPIFTPPPEPPPPPPPPPPPERSDDEPPF